MSTKIRLAVIAGADAALKYRKQHPHASDAEVMKYATECAESLAKNIDAEDY